jgi:hypothetical protein
MSRILQRLNVLAILLLGGVLGAVMMAQIRPGDQVSQRDIELGRGVDWPKTLQVAPAHKDDPVKLVRILKAGNELVPGKYNLPRISGQSFGYSPADDPTDHPVYDWLSDISVVVRNESSKNIVSIGVSLVLPIQHTGVQCGFVPTAAHPRDPLCVVDPDWCDEGCPELFNQTFNWGFIPAVTASGLESRYRGEHRRLSPFIKEGVPLQGTAPLLLAPGQELALTAVGRGDSWISLTNPGKGFRDALNGIVGDVGINEAMGEKSCDERASSKTGCAFAHVPRFNIGIDIVYFEDGTIWGNYGYGYAKPNPGGIYRRFR